MWFGGLPGEPLPGIEDILMGKHRPSLTVAEILRGVPLSWREQEVRFLQLA